MIHVIAGSPVYGYRVILYYQKREFTLLSKYIQICFKSTPSVKLNMNI